MIVGISAKSRRGKDMMASWMQGNSDYSIHHWADALYEECQQPHDIGLYVGQYPSETSIDGVMYKDECLASRVSKWLDTVGGVADYSGLLADRNGVLRGLDSHKMTGKDAPLLQWWGTEYRRTHYGADYWIKQVAAKIADLGTPADERHIVIPDTRFVNEAEWIRAQPDGVLIRIESAEPFEPTGRDDTHIAETQLDNWEDWDYILHNDYSPQFLVRAGYAIDSIHEFGRAERDIREELFPQFGISTRVRRDDWLIPVDNMGGII